MEINWQEVFYFTSSLTMIVFLIIGIWLLWMFFLISKLIKNLTATADKWSHFTDDIRYLKEDIKLKVSKFLLKILNKGSQNNQRIKKI